MVSPLFTPPPSSLCASDFSFDEPRLSYPSDFNYERSANGVCLLVEGLPPPDHSGMCKNDDNMLEYFEPTGYRRLPITTCEGGDEYDKSLEPKPCPGKEDDFNQRHGLSGVAIFFAVIIPFIIAGGIGYWVWMNWANNFGQIRLGEQCKSFAFPLLFLSSHSLPPKTTLLIDCVCSIIRQRSSLHQIPRPCHRRPGRNSTSPSPARNIPVPLRKQPCRQGCCKPQIYDPRQFREGER